MANASISGETTSGGAARIDAALGRQPDVVVLALGGNDGLRGLPVGEMRRTSARSARRRPGARVLLVGMQMPPNYGPKYTQEFDDAFAEVARETKSGYVPFLLEGVAGQRTCSRTTRSIPPLRRSR